MLETVLRLVTQWDRAEAELQHAENEALGAENTPGSLTGLSMEQQLAKKRQIFAPPGAYKMLSRELKDMMLEPSPGVAVSTVNNSVWEWDMRLSDFEASTPIAQVPDRHDHTPKLEISCRSWAYTSSPALTSFDCMKLSLCASVMHACGLLH